MNFISNIAESHIFQGFIVGFVFGALSMLIIWEYFDAKRESDS